MWGAVAVGKESSRGLGELRDRLHELEIAHGELEEKVDGMTKAEEIAAAVTVAIRAERRNLFTVPRQLAAGLIALIVAVPAAHELISWLGF